jgi:MFS family permease
LEKMQAPLLAELPTTVEKRGKASVKTLFGEQRASATLLLWTAIFMAFATLYFLTLWIPKLASNAGLPLHLAIYGGTVFNLGAFAGIVLQGYLSTRFGLKRIIFAYFMLTAALMMVFGQFVGSAVILVLFGLLGFGIQGGFIGLYAVAARLYPTEARATGVGWAIGLGRAGAVVGPLLGGVLIGMGWSLAINFMIFAVPAVVAALTTLRIDLKK